MIDYPLMCCNPIRIVNQGYRPFNLYTPLHISVPCGHCWQCNLKRINELAFRIMYECSSSKVLPFFVTLTYKDDYLPILYFRDVKNNISTVSCWNRNHVQRYFKNIRRQLQYYFGIDSNSIKYYCTCERGSKESYYDSKGHLRTATARPHYHLIFLLYLDGNILPVRNLPSDFLKYSKDNNFGLDLSSFFKWLLHSKWFYGMVDDKALCRDLVSAVRYVTKYVCKDVGESLFHIDMSDIVKLRDPEYDGKVHNWYLRLVPSDSDKSFVYNGCSYVPGKGSKLPKPINFNSILPRPFGSINLGLKFILNLSYDELLDYLSKKKKVVLPSQNSSTLISLPSYYVRKVSKYQLNLSNRKSYKSVVYDSGVSLNKKYEPHFNVRKSWDNEFGLSYLIVPSSLTKTQYTEIGLKIQRLKFKDYVSSLKSSLCNIGSNPSFYLDLYSNYSNLPSCFRRSNDVIYSFDKVRGFVQYLQNHKLSFREVAKAVCLQNDNQSDSVGSTSQMLVSILNFYEQCKFYLAHLQHLKHDVVYRQKLGSTAFDNPDLFINHFI